MAALDLKMVEALILRLDEEKIKTISSEPDFAEKFSEMVFKEFKGKQLKETLSKKLTKRELSEKYDLYFEEEKSLESEPFEFNTSSNPH
mmetsp:Transcript_34678/g.33863  ORF Transcript_34678/g.33863 Transcript_34678/m.33863 type:complete len:89 (+) Transcript_34678:453-719(+)